MWTLPPKGAVVKASPKMAYLYVKSSALRYDPKENREVFDLNNAKIESRIAKKIHRRVQGLGFVFKSKKKATRAFRQGKYSGDEMRTCALYNLVIQADLVMDGWKECGYLLQAGEKGEPMAGNLPETGGHAVISAPPNITDCTPDKMNSEPCKTMWTRTLARNHPSLLSDCLKRIRGVSQTCNSFDKCGPHYQIPKKDKEIQFRSICHTEKVGYFKEPMIQRMCGVCDMYRATVSLSFVSPEAGFKPDPFKESAAARLPGASVAAQLVLALAAAAVGLHTLRPAA